MWTYDQHPNVGKSPQELRVSYLLYEGIAGLTILALALTDKFLFFNLGHTRTPLNALVASAALFGAFLTLRVNPLAFRFKPFLIAMGCFLLYFLTALCLAPLQPNVQTATVGALIYFGKTILVFQTIYTIGVNPSFSYRMVRVLYVFVGYACVSSLTYLALIRAEVLLPSYGFTADDTWYQSYWVLSAHHADYRLAFFFSEANKYAVFLILPFFLAIRDAVFSRRPIYFVLSGLIGLNLLLTGSFAVITAIAMTICFWMFARTRSMARQIATIFASVVLVATIALFIRTYLIEGDLPGIPNKAASLNSRIEEISDGLNLVNDNPFGVGLANRGAYASDFAGNIRNYGIVIVEDMAKGGWFLVGARCIMIFTVFYLVFGAIRRRSAGVPCGLAAVATMLASQIYGPMEQRVFLVALGLFLALHYHSTYSAVQKGQLRTRRAH